MKAAACFMFIFLASCTAIDLPPSSVGPCLEYRSIPAIADEFGMRTEVCVRR